MYEEYRALCDVVYAGRHVPLMLVPAMPAAGRVTVGGVHRIERGGRRVPLHATEYACDGAFAYRSVDAWLLQCGAEDRSDGDLARTCGHELTLQRLRGDGAAAVVASLADGPSVLAADAETQDDLRLLAAGVRAAEAAGI